MANTVSLQFAGDASQLQRAGQQSEQAVAGVGAAANQANDDFRNAAQGSGAMSDRMAKLGATVDGASTAIADAAGTMQALADVQDFARQKAQRLAQAQTDVAQAQEDANQAMIDGKQAVLDVAQAGIDAEQALLDQVTAQKDYNDAVKEHGAGSVEARQAAIDLKQANEDLRQANLDVEQAQADSNQAVIDGKQAQVDLNDAMHEATPPQLQEWADKLNLVAPLLSGLVGVVALVTAAQWAWNIAQLASPLTWIILGIVALVAIIVLIATKTTWFQDLWRVTWGWIKDAAAAVADWATNTLWPGLQAVWQGIVDGVLWVRDMFSAGFQASRDVAARAVDGIVSIPGRIASAFSRLADIVTAPFRAGFNAVARAWNATVGSLSWTVPDWVPGLGGGHISAPRLPTYHRGGIVPGALGAETLALLQAGERVTPTGGRGAATVLEIRSGGSRLDDLLVEILSNAIRARGGDVQLVLGSA